MVKFYVTAITIVVLLCNFKTYKLFDLDISEILEQAKILNDAKEIFDAIKEGDFSKTIKAISKHGLPLLESISKLAQNITAEFDTEPKELTFLKEQFRIINQKMDYVDQQFEEVKGLMDWNVIKIQYSRYERNTNVLQDLIQVITDSAPSVRKVVTDNFLRNYEQLYDNTAEHIYEGFVNQQKLFSENLIIAIRKFTKDHRFQVEKFFMGNLQLILKSLEVEAFYLNLKNFQIKTFWQENWKDRLNNLTNIMNSVTEQILENWLQQSNTDIEIYNMDNNKLSTAEYAKGLYNFLNDKFRNRMWLVLVYEPLRKGRDHGLKVCNGVSQLQSRGHNVAVTSLELDSKEVDLNVFNQLCDELPSKLGKTPDGPAQHILEKYVIPRMNCNTNQIGAVIRSKSEKVYMSPPNRVAKCRWSGHYKKIINIHKTLDIVVMA